MKKELLSPTLSSTTQSPPSKIDILGKLFKINKISEDDESKEDCDGLMELSEQILWYRKQNALGYNQDTIIHETLHAIDEMLILKLSEQQVHQLAVALLALVKHNPKFVEWISIKDVH